MVKRYAFVVLGTLATTCGLPSIGHAQVPVRDLDSSEVLELALSSDDFALRNAYTSAFLDRVAARGVVAVAARKALQDVLESETDLGRLGLAASIGAGVSTSSEAFRPVWNSTIRARLRSADDSTAHVLFARIAQLPEGRQQPFVGAVRSLIINDVLTPTVMDEAMFVLGRAGPGGRSEIDRLDAASPPSSDVARSIRRWRALHGG